MMDRGQGGMVARGKERRFVWSDLTAENRRKFGTFAVTDRERLWWLE